MEIDPRSEPFALGIDVSRYQGNINWSKVAASGIRFVFVRLGWANGDGSIVMDSEFHKNAQAAKAAGLDVGAYLFSYLNSVTSARIAATKMLELVAPYIFLMPLALDYEDATIYKNKTREQNTLICNTFMSIIAQNGYLPMFYSYKAFCDSYMDMATLDKYEGLWIANYSGTIGIDDTAIWQYSATGRVNGISGDVDMNRMYWDIPGIVGEQYCPQTNGFAPVVGLQLEVFGTKHCEVFSSPSIYATIPTPSGESLRLTSGDRYTVTEISHRLYDGYPMCTITLADQTVYVALLDDRCRLVDTGTDTPAVITMIAMTD